MCISNIEWSLIWPFFPKLLNFQLKPSIKYCCKTFRSSENFRKLTKRRNLYTEYEKFMNISKPTMNFGQIEQDFRVFNSINTKRNNRLVEERFCTNPGAVSLCRYQIKDNEVYRTCFGEEGLLYYNLKRYFKKFFSFRSF